MSVSGERSPSDRDLIGEAKKGSRSAFERLVYRYESPLLRFLLGRLGQRVDAEDALQDTFAAAYRYLQSYRDRYEVSTWLYAIAVRAAGRIHRRRPRSVPISPRDEPAADAEPPETGIWDLARECLSAGAFNALWLYYHEDWAVADIATTLRRPQSWVKVNLHRARVKLARRLTIEDFR